MPKVIPDDFNFKKEKVDANEEYIRDTLLTNIHGWAKFRYLINGGNSAECLLSNEPIHENIKKAFIELGKANYEVINALGCLKLEMNYLKEWDNNLNFFVRKSIKEFYYHAGCLLDNLGRLIYIIKDPNAAFERGKLRYKRHTIDWKAVEKMKIPHFDKYSKYFDGKPTKEILTLRNNLTHNWFFIIILETNNREIIPKIAAEVRSQNNFVWHYDEIDEFEDQNKTYIRVSDFIESDYNYLEDLQNNLYLLLCDDLKYFEENNKVKII